MSKTSSLLLIALVIVAVAIGLILISYKNEIARVRSAVAGGGSTVKTAAGVIEYAERGAGTPLLSIHGSGGGYDQGLSIAADLVGDGFRIIAPSRFGYLGTAIPSDVSPSAQADAHVALLATLNVDKVVVVGTSAGALSAIELALRHPEKVAALVLIVPATYAPTNPVAIEKNLGNQLAFWLVNAGADFVWWAAETVAPSVLIRFIGVSPEIVAAAPKAERDRVMQFVRSIQPLSRRVSGINIDSNPDDHRPPLENIGAPTLIVSARDDLFNTLPAAEFAGGTIPNARLVVFDTGGHLLVGHKREVRSIVADFLIKAGVRTSNDIRG